MQKRETDIFDDIFDESEALSEVSTETTKNLSVLVSSLSEADLAVTAAEEALKEAKAKRHNLATGMIPSLMNEMGVSRLDVDGVTVTIKPIVAAYISKARKEEVHAWLRSEGLGDIIKNDITVSFGSGEDNVAKDVLGMLEDRGVSPVRNERIHPSTLKAFVAERLRDGKPIDLDMFGAYVADTAILKRI